MIHIVATSQVSPTVIEIIGDGKVEKL